MHVKWMNILYEYTKQPESNQNSWTVVIPRYHQTFVMHIDSLLPSSFFNPLEWLWKRQQLCLYMLPCKMEANLYTAFSSPVSMGKF